MQLPPNVTCADPSASLLPICAPAPSASGDVLWRAANMSIASLVASLEGNRSALLLLGAEVPANATSPELPASLPPRPAP
jgi:hypothetical protein